MHQHIMCFYYVLGSFELPISILILFVASGISLKTERRVSLLHLLTSIGQKTPISTVTQYIQECLRLSFILHVLSETLIIVFTLLNGS